MPRGQELEELSSKELHDRAVHLAVRRLDAGFLWRLLRAIPAAEAATGNLDEATADTVALSALLSDLIGSGEGEVAEALRPMYLEYLRQHDAAQ